MLKYFTKWYYNLYSLALGVSVSSRMSRTVGDGKSEYDCYGLEQPVPIKWSRLVNYYRLHFIWKSLSYPLYSNVHLISIKWCYGANIRQLFALAHLTPTRSVSRGCSGCSGCMCTLQNNSLLWTSINTSLNRAYTVFKAV